MLKLPFVEFIICVCETNTFCFSKGNTYHIPICIWVMDTHPNNAPMCYVTPTAEMSIKISNFVDHNGKIYLPYLHEWIPVSFEYSKIINCIIFITYIDN